jgi:hypothetical protein
LTPLLPPLRSLRIPFSPTITTVRPYAVTNPIWVDFGANGWTAPSSYPSWATSKDRGLVTRPVGQKPAFASKRHGAEGRRPAAPTIGPSHDHRAGLGRMTREARTFLDRAARGEITERSILDALNALRYVR